MIVSIDKNVNDRKNLQNILMFQILFLTQKKILSVK